MSALRAAVIGQPLLNLEKFSQEPKDRVFQELSNDVSQVPKIVNLKIAKNGGEKKSGPSTKSLPKFFGLEQKLE